jgi:ArsR family transcriptional regulator
VSRHLKVLCDAGLLSRKREGAWVFYGAADPAPGGAAALGRIVEDLLPADDAQLREDRLQLDRIKGARAEKAAAYFRKNAPYWSKMRSLHADERMVEQALLDSVAEERIGSLLDIGTGTGRILELFAPRIERGLGLDLSREMLSVAAANLAAGGHDHCQVRHGDMYRVPAADDSFDVVTIHQVLHYSERPAAVIAEASRVLKPGGVLAIADIAPHEMEELRAEHQHRRLGFTDDEVAEWCRAARMDMEGVASLPGDPLTVVIWTARKSNVPADLAEPIKALAAMRESLTP